MDAENYRQKREQFHKLRDRNETLLRERQGIVQYNRALEAKIGLIEKEIRRYRAVNVELAERVEEELIKRENLASVLKKVEGEVQNLKQGHEFQKQRYRKNLIEAEKLERELEKLNAKKKALQKYVGAASGAENALNFRKESLKSSLVEAHQETKKLENRLRPETKAPKVDLRQRIAKLGASNVKEASALYNCLRSIISNIEENEFEGVEYKTTVNKNKTKIGARLYFSNVNTQYADLKEHLRPVIMTLGKRFGNTGLEIETKVKRNSSGLVSAIDVTVTVKFRPPKTLEASL